MLGVLTEQESRSGSVEALLPRLEDALAATCTLEEHFRAWSDELRLWVRWRRIPAYWLTSIFQSVTQRRKSIYHYVACELHADAQTNLADDSALQSLENAYHACNQSKTILGDKFPSIEYYLQRKLSLFYRYYYLSCRPFDSANFNPLSEHLYTSVSGLWLHYGVVEDDKGFIPKDGNALRNVLPACKGKDFAYYGVLARHFLGFFYANKGQDDLAAEQYRLALEQALDLNLDTEIGHLRRHYGAALRFLGDLDGARSQFDQAYSYERAARWYCSYWYAMSAREIGDTLMHMAGRRVESSARVGRPMDASLVFDNPGSLKPALQAYHDGRLLFDIHIAVQAPFPVSRASKEQIFRSFSGNAIQAAALSQSSLDLLAEVECNGPREATMVVAEITAANQVAPASLAEFRRNRAVFNAELNTFGGNFEKYLSNIGETNAARRAYVAATTALSTQIMQAQMSDEVAQEILNTRIANTVFLLFHVGQMSSMAVIVDMTSGSAGPFPLSFGEGQLREIHRELAGELKTAGTMQDPGEAIQSAVENVTSRYEELLRPLLEPIAPILQGRHLKIFPRLQMNAVPLHALKVGGKYLIEYCDISYGQTLGLFLQARRKQSEQHTANLRVVLGGVPCYNAILSSINQSYGASVHIDDQPEWPVLTASLAAEPARDVLFACHGSYNADSPDSSYLYLSGSRTVSFSQVFADLDLRNCRSVIMGACESGLARSEVNAEYIGLPSAMLSSGVRYVIGALWQVNQLATAVLVNRYLELLADGETGVPAALCRAQRGLMAMTRDDLSRWVRGQFSPGLEPYIQKRVAKMDERPFARPFYWAGFQVSGDV